LRLQSYSFFRKSQNFREKKYIKIMLNSQCNRPLKEEYSKIK